MTRVSVVLTLVAAALLEAGGDALIRRALDRPLWAARAPLFLVGAAVLFAYGLTVNAPKWDFGRLLGLYLVFFFIAAQVMAWLVLRQRPSIPTLLGGALIAAGGVVITLGQAELAFTTLLGHVGPAIPGCRRASARRFRLGVAAGRRAKARRQAQRPAPTHPPESRRSCLSDLSRQNRDNTPEAASYDDCVGEEKRS